MARNDVYLNINALSPADAVVTGQQDMTAATVPELVLGDTPTFNFYFTDNTNVWPSWAGNASYSLTWALSDAVAGDFSPAATTGNATPITGGWSVILPLNSYDLVGLLNTKRVGQPYPVTNLWQQLRVTDPSGNEVTRAMFWTPVRYRAISDTQNTESASPTGGRFVTVNNVNTLTTPTAAQFYSANPVPTSALGTAANGELLIGNGTGFTKATLTAGTGVSITNGSGSITISATDGDITLDDGTAAAPSLKFTSDTDTGLYRPAANTLGVAVGGAQVAYFDANGITTVGAGATIDGSVHAANGNANNPSLSFTGDDNTGFFRHQPDEIGITLGGTQKATLTSTTFSITPNLSTSGNLTVSGTTGTIGSNSGFTWDLGSGNNFIALSTGRPTITAAVASGNNAGAALSLLARGGGSRRTWNLETDTTEAGDFVFRQSTTEAGSTFTNALYFSAARNATFSGNLTVSGGTITGGTSGLSLASGGTNQNITLTPSGTGATIIAGSNSAATFGGSTAVSIIRNNNSTAGAFNTLFFVNKDNFGSAIIATKQTNNGNNGDNLHFVTKQNPGASWNTGMVLTTNDNLLIGTTTDGGQRLQVAGTAEIQSTLTVKGAEAGPTTGISSIIQNTTSANDRVAALRLVNASNQWNLRAVGSGDTFSIGPGLSGSETNYFTLSSTGNATFAGTIKPQQAATASAPTYVKGVIYFDTTLNKLRVGGATGWETVTSV